MRDSFYEHVKSGEKHLNDLESQILRYIISLRGDLEQATSKGIAAHFFVAPNTIVRLAHKLGFTGFTDLKHSYLISLERNRYVIETIPLDLQIIQSRPSRRSYVPSSAPSASSSSARDSRSSPASRWRRSSVSWARTPTR